MNNYDSVWQAVKEEEGRWKLKESEKLKPERGTTVEMSYRERKLNNLFRKMFLLNYLYSDVQKAI